MNTKTKEEQLTPIEVQLPKVKFSDLGINPQILKTLQGLNLDTPTPIQCQAIPVALKGSDLVGIAQTGTGKTFAFGIPMLQKIISEKGQGLVIVPTRELALQVAESLKRIAKDFNFNMATIIGGENMGRQLFSLRKRPQIIIATPGRLIDHLKRKTIRLDQVKTLVLDEADMMFDLGFTPQIEEILRQAPKERQTMLFSATMPPEIARLTANHLKLPVRIEVAPQGTTAKNVEQEVFVLRPSEKFSYLEKLIKENAGSILVFVRTRYSVRDIRKKLVSLGHNATEIHSNLSLVQRRKSLESFKSKRNRIMVATDVAARGLDINGIELVINYDLPDSSPDYVHRIGRTARAGKSGKAISLATPNQLKNIRDIESLIKMTLNVTEHAKLEAIPQRKFSRGRRGNNFGRRGSGRPAGFHSRRKRF